MLNRGRSKSPILIYQAAISLQTLRFVHASGPYKGVTADSTIAKATLGPLFMPGETTLADGAYSNLMSSNEWVISLGNLKSPKPDYRFLVKCIHRGRAPIEQIFHFVREWGVARGPWRFDYDLHRECMDVIFKLVNARLRYEPLYSGG